jgi:hypothetical protein
MSMPESAKLTIKHGDQERQRGEGKITYPRMHAHPDLLLGSKEVGNATMRSSAPPIRVFRHAPAPPSFLPASCSVIGTRFWLLQQPGPWSSQGPNRSQRPKFSARFQHSQTSIDNDGCTAKVATPEATASATTGASGALAVAASPGRFGLHVQKPLGTFGAQETSYSSSNFARAIAGHLVTPDESAIYLPLSVLFLFYYFYYYILFLLLLTSNSEKQEDQRREQLQSLEV